MKSKHLIYCLLAFCVFTLSSCGPDNVDYANKVDGSYDVTITTNINLKYEGNSIPSIATEIETKGTITKDNESGNVTIRIEGVNGAINDIVMKAFCSGLGMKIDQSSYDGIISSTEYGIVECMLTLKNPTTTISNARIFNWDSTVSGQCVVNYIGQEMTCETSGTINFNLTPITE